MSQQSPLPQNDPVLIAFQKLKKTPEYQNAVKWTIKAENESQADGELWFAFLAGYDTAVRAVKLGIAEEIENHSYLALAGTHELCAWLDSLTKRLREESQDKRGIKEEGLFLLIESKYSGFRVENMDQFLGYEAGQFDGASSALDTVANWIEEDLGLGSFDPKRYIETLRRRARDTFSSKVERG